MAEGMETIAQPITLVDHPKAEPLESGKGEVVFDGSAKAVLDDEQLRQDYLAI